MADGWFDWLPDLGTLGKILAWGTAGAGAVQLPFSIMQGIQQRQQADQVRRRQLALSKQLQGVAGAPLPPVDPTQFYTPMSAAEQTARRRAIEADLATRGIPRDAGYTTNLISEQMAGTETDRWKAALVAAQQAQQAAQFQQLLRARALQAAVPQYPQYPQMPQFNLGDILRYIQGSQAPQPPRRVPVEPTPAGAASPWAMSPETSQAFGMQRAGERDPFMSTYSRGIDQLEGIGQTPVTYPSEFYT